MTSEEKLRKEKLDAVAEKAADDAKELKDKEKAEAKEASDKEKQEADELKASEKADAEAQKDAEKEAKKSGKVYSGSGAFVREYTKEHSDDDNSYLEKAKGYAEKIGGSVR